MPVSSSLMCYRNIYVGDLADMVGRRVAILAGCIVFLLGGGIQAGAQNIHYMYGGRFLAGMGIGMLAMLAPLYQAEIAHPSIRGRLTTLQQFMLGIGALIASFIGYGCYHGLTGPAQWRVPLGMSSDSMHSETWCSLSRLAIQLLREWLTKVCSVQCLT